MDKYDETGTSPVAKASKISEASSRDIPNPDLQ